MNKKNPGIKPGFLNKQHRALSAKYRPDNVEKYDS